MMETPGEAEIAAFVLDAPRGCVRALGGLDAATLRALLDAVEPQPSGRRALSLTLESGLSAEALIESVLEACAAVALTLWPTVGVVRTPWAEAAARLVRQGRPPRVKGTHRAIEIAELARVISPTGLVLVIDADEASLGPRGAAWIRGLEWVAERIDGAVVALFSDLPPNAPPFDRILYDAMSVSRSAAPAEALEPVAWLAPWRGLPHPMSDVEQRLAMALRADPELCSLFAFNQTVATVRGGTPKVDLVWARGRLAIEIDGYGSHGNRQSFMRDRHRDYELILSGFTVLRLTNDEIAEDLEKAIEKIRDVVTFRRGRMGKT